MSFVHQAVEAGLTDVWSAIRTSTATRLQSLLGDTFRLPDVEVLFFRLSAICADAETPWQAKEGAVLGIGSILKSFRIEPVKTYNFVGDPATSRSNFFQLQVKRRKGILISTYFNLVWQLSKRKSPRLSSDSNESGPASPTFSSPTNDSRKFEKGTRRIPRS